MLSLSGRKKAKIRPKVLRIRRAVIVSLGLLLVIVLILFHFQPMESSPSALPVGDVTTSDEQKGVSVGLPVRLKIPKINVDVLVKYMGLTVDGDMEAPDGASDTGWYKLGSRPGEKGSAVIAGHYGRWKTGESSVFDNLDKLGKGDLINVEDENGLSISFVVREFRTYRQDETVPEVFVSNDGKAHLNLITCKGEWDKVKGMYPDRLVVFADRD